MMAVGKWGKDGRGFRYGWGLTVRRGVRSNAGSSDDTVASERAVLSKGYRRTIVVCAVNATRLSIWSRNYGG